MYAVERLSSYITRGVYTVSGPFHPFGGAVDIIVVQQQDGSFKSSPWNVRFGKFQGVLKTKEKIVTICVNGTDAEFHMYLDHKGEAYFLKDANQNEGEPFMSPPSSGDETDGQTKNGWLRNSQSCNYDNGHREPVGQFNVESGNIVARTNSERPRMFGFVFGRRRVKEGGNSGARVERVSSMERAEIAADLLEVKWSTNLSTNDRKGTDSSKLASGGDGVGNMVDGEWRPSMQFSDGGLSNDNKVTSHLEEISDNSESNNVTAEHSDEPTRPGYPDLRTFEEVIEIYSSETGELPDENEVLSSSPKATEFDMSFKESVLVNPIVDLYNHEFHRLSSDKDCHSASDVSGGEKEDREVSSFFYCEASSESSYVVHDVSSSAALEALSSLSAREENKKNTEHVHVTSQQPSEENLRCELRPSTVKENFECSNENLELDNRVDFMQTDHVSGEACKEPDATSIKYLSTESLSSHDVSLVTSQPTKTSQDILEEKTAQENVTASTSEISRNLNEMDGGSANFSYQKPGINVDGHLSSSEEAKSNSSFIPTGSFNTSVGDLELHKAIERDEFDMCGFPGEDIVTHEFGSKLDMSGAINGDIFLSESLEEDNFLFNEINDFGSNEHPGQSVIMDEVKAEDCPSISPESDFGHNGRIPDACDAKISDGSRVQTCPISIPERKSCSEEKEYWVGSLPNIRSHIHELERSDVHPTSHSLHIKPKTVMWGMPEKDTSSSANIESRHESNLLQLQPASENVPIIDYPQRREEQSGMPVDVAVGKKEQNGMLISPAVEMSLCRHLLYEGMGAEEASKMFDAEKVDLEKFSALGPSIVKNDSLVIRIDGRYFPWNAAAPIILGIATFGHEGIFDAEGMIAVDQTDKIPEEDSSRAIVQSGGSWRLWPFNLIKSRSMNPTCLASTTNRNADKGTEMGSLENKKIRDDNDNVQRSRVMKNKVRSVTPTSEQLASLRLKEGQNLVTFSFSTAMLGRQQVDARIYLWKWNTRIVVSDVDGTITKSDVLGQFMPLVGKDWSQTGVTHLFSAIKENGYQLLFLSARAISQAYLTRQFLFNLKQDGKALPDGPVVISPDGLFPSLYREVIRRAPHEFKIACLEEIRALFPPECNPFYAGFGNRDTDEISYVKVGIPKGKIFIINPKGEVAVNRRVDTKSYTSLRALVNSMFPAMSSAEQEDFNSWNYWKLPLPDIGV